MKKNVWLMNHYATNMFADLGGRHYWFAKNLQKNGYNPVIFCASTFHNSDKQIDLQGKKYIEKTTETGIKFVFVKAPPYKGNGFSRIKNMISFAWNLYFVAKNYAKKHENPDVILASSVHPLTIVAGIFLGRYFKVPCIGEIRDLWPESIVRYGMISKEGLFAKILYSGEKWIYRNVNALIFTMEGAYDYINDKGWNDVIGKEKIHYINNGVDITVFDNNKKCYVIADKDLNNKNSFNIVYTGSIRGGDDLNIILDVAKELDNDKVRFLIWGDGDRLAALKKRISDEHIENVKFKGAVEKKYIPYIVSMADANIAHVKSTPICKYGVSLNKIFEYLAAGKPILVDFESKYNPVLLNDAGLCVDKQSVDVVVDMINEMVCLSEKRYHYYANNARNAAENKYNFDCLTEKLIGVIETQ